ncbi:MAG TPA: FAD-dependent oxidoreductase [Acidimicrobiia bacterium]
MSTDAQLVVVGLGLIGAAAVRHAAVMGSDVVGVGPGEPSDWSTHVGPFASHYDSGRITRVLDPSPTWSELARRSISQYPEIAGRSGVEFHAPVGLLWVGGLADLRPVGASHGVDTTAIPFGNRADLPFGFDEDDETILEPAPAGHIDPRKMLRAQQMAAVHEGASLVDDVVESIEEGDDGVRLHLRSGGRLHAATAIVSAGAYAGLLTGRQVPIVPTTEAIVLGEVSSAEASRLSGLPAVIHQDASSGHLDVYAVPPVRYPDGRWYLKLGAETESDHIVDDHESVRRWMAGEESESRRGLLIDKLTGMLPGVEFLSYAVKPCIYARTPTMLPFVDHLGPRLVVAAGGNGRAAKSADAIGSLAARLALSGDWDDPLPSTAFALPV